PADQAAPGLPLPPARLRDRPPRLGHCRRLAGLAAGRTPRRRSRAAGRLLRRLSRLHRPPRARTLARRLGRRGCRPLARPVIAITGPQRGAFGPRLLVALAVRLYGGQPLQLRPSDAGREHRFDGVVITGGHDVNPVLYAAAPEVEPRYDEARDALEVAIIDEALERHLPVLGICRGAQLLNVRLGGTLFQQLRTRRRRTSH